ncbi:class I SAM-dependent methyltransferase [Streptomyces sp. NPDC001255]|uniref:class I SAM-dependent methyltransferase n=1 Tax=Streptomyces sp. NPDC001255 TaxID=3364550 RepID=UPI00368EC2FA
MLAEPRTALELGSGEGREAAWLARSGVRVTGVDVSPVQVARARRWRAGVGGLDFVCEDVETYAARTGRVWDVVYSIWGPPGSATPRRSSPWSADGSHPADGSCSRTGRRRRSCTGQRSCATARTWPAYRVGVARRRNGVPG